MPVTDRSTDRSAELADRSIARLSETPDRLSDRSVEIPNRPNYAPSVSINRTVGYRSVLPDPSVFTVITDPFLITSTPSVTRPSGAATNTQGIGRYSFNPVTGIQTSSNSSGKTLLILGLVAVGIYYAYSRFSGN